MKEDDGRPETGTTAPANTLDDRLDETLLPAPAFSPHTRWQAPLKSKVLSVIFVLGCLGLVVVCVMAIFATEGFNQLLIGLTTVFPTLVMVAAGLRMLSVWTREVRLEERCIDHRQFLKNYRVPVTQLKQIEVLAGPAGIETLRIRWSGTPFYIDADGLEDFEAFFSHLRAFSPAPLAMVTGFEPVD